MAGDASGKVILNAKPTQEISRPLRSDDKRRFQSAFRAG